MILPVCLGFFLFIMILIEFLKMKVMKNLHSKRVFVGYCFEVQIQFITKLKTNVNTKENDSTPSSIPHC